MIAWWVALAFAGPAEDEVAVAEKVLQQVRASHAAGQTSAEDVYVWSVRVRDAQRAAGAPGADAAHAQRMRALLTNTEGMVASGVAPSRDLDAVRYYVLAADRATPVAVSTPGPAAPPTTPAPAGPGVEACFETCDGAFDRCATEAEHLRLGVGALPPDPACLSAAEGKCGAGRSQTATECRDLATRACVASKQTAACAREQTLCAAKCR